MDQWERFALPLLEVDIESDGAMLSGNLLDVAGAHLSAVRKVNERVEVRLWNEHANQVDVSIGDSRTVVAPFGISTIHMSVS